MRRALPSAPWLFAGLAAVLGPLVIATGEATSIVWRTLIVLAGAAAALIGWRVRRLPAIIPIALVVSAVRIGIEPLGDHTGTVDALSWRWVVSDVVVGIALTATLGIVVRRRMGTFRGRDLVDACSVVIGAALTAWIIIASPLLDTFGVGMGLSIASAAYLTLTALFVTFTLDLMFSGLTRNRALWFIVGAAVANLAATLTASLRLVEVFPLASRSVSLGWYTIAVLLLYAGLIHEDARDALERREPSADDRPHTPVRLILMTAGFLAPAILVASLAPASRTDAIVRTVGTLVLVLTVVVRLVIAMQDNGRARHLLIRQLHRDDLTNLPTRWRFVEHLDELLESTWRSDRLPTVIQINLDRFKNINDSLGYNDANRVLAIVAERLHRVAEHFGAHAARSGGDDFVLGDGNIRSSTEAMLRVDAVRKALSAPIQVGGNSIFVRASIGVAVAPPRRTLTAEELMRRAEIATHRAKADGRDRVAVFDDSMQSHLAYRMDVEHALHGAIGRSELSLYHQPIVQARTGRVTGFEALVRWHRSDGALVPPADFIPIAEESGVICDIGTWALREALAQHRGWIDSGTVPPTTTISVNVSPRQIAEPGFADVVRDALDSTGVSPHLLWIEMTESMMLDEPDLAQHTLRQIRAMGVRLALDDFGTGYSSLSLLQQFPIQRIKIDRAFVQGIAERSNDRSLVRTIVAMAQSMGLDLVAEGVETVEQLKALQELECDQAQGFLISHPVPADAMRSTMGALAELAELSLFSHEVVEPQAAVPPAEDPAFQLLGNLSSRPLGQPQL